MQTPGAVGQDPGTPQKGPRVWLDMDQAELDAAYTQSVWAPNREQLVARHRSNSEIARTRVPFPFFCETTCDILRACARSQGECGPHATTILRPGAVSASRLTTYGGKCMQRSLMTFLLCGLGALLTACAPRPPVPVAIDGVTVRTEGAFVLVSLAYANPTATPLTIGLQPRANARTHLADDTHQSYTLMATFGIGYGADPHDWLALAPQEHATVSFLFRANDLTGRPLHATRSRVSNSCAAGTPCPLSPSRSRSRRASPSWCPELGVNPIPPAERVV